MSKPAKTKQAKKKALPAKAKSEIASLNLPAQIEQALIKGDLAPLSPEMRVQLYNMTCQSLGLNPLTKPFEYIELKGQGGVKRLVLYCTKNAAEQLREIKKISIDDVKIEIVDDVVYATATGSREGRTDKSIAVVDLRIPVCDDKLKGYNGTRISTGEERSNFIMKAETKAKRRLTLSLSGLSFLDEDEANAIRDIIQSRKLEAGTVAITKSDTGIDDETKKRMLAMPELFKKVAGKDYLALQAKKVAEIGEKNNWDNDLLIAWAQEQIRKHDFRGLV